MLKASELKNKENVMCINGKHEGKVFTVISNHVDDVIFLADENAQFYTGYHLFYDENDDHEFAAYAFGIELS